MPMDASSVSDFTISGNSRRFGRRRPGPCGTRPEVGHRNAVIGQQLLRQRLVARQHQAARIAAGVRHPQQFEVAHHVLVEDGDRRGTPRAG